LEIGDPLGAAGRNRASGTPPGAGAASGWEMDTSSAGTALPGVVVNACDPAWPGTVDWAADFSAPAPPGTDRGTPPANLELLARGTNSGEGTHAADMTCYRHPGGGLVFAAGSIPFGGCLADDPNLGTVVLNAIDEALGAFDQSFARYASVWVRDEGPPWIAHHGLTGDEHQALFEELPDQGYRPRVVSGYAVGGVDRYASIWERIDGPEWIAHHWLTGDEHQALFEELPDQGYRPRVVSGYAVGGVDRYASIWERTNGTAFEGRHRRRGGAYERTVNRLGRRGFRPIAVSGYSL